MSKPKIVSDYLEAAVPKGLTASRRKLLTDELESHIYDKAEYYIEIGYSEEESFEKAVADMGDAEAVNIQLDEIYKENSKLKFTLTAVIFLSCLLFTLCTPMGAVAPIKSYAPPIYVLLSFVLYFFLITFIVVCYRRKAEKMLKTVGIITSVTAILGMPLLLTPFADAVQYNVSFLIEKIFHTPFESFRVFDTVGIVSLVLYFAAILSVPILSFFLLSRLQKGKSAKHKPKTSRMIYTFAAVTVLMTAVYWQATDYYGYQKVVSIDQLYTRYDGQDSTWEEEKAKMTDLLADYQNICLGQSASKIDQTLLEKGYESVCYDDFEEIYSDHFFSEESKNVIEYYKSDDGMVRETICFPDTPNPMRKSLNPVTPDYMICDIDGCYDYIKSLKTGESEEETVNRLFDFDCVLSSVKTRRSEHGEQSEYTIFASKAAVKKPKPLSRFFVLDTERNSPIEVKISLEFENGKLTYASVWGNKNYDYELKSPKS